MDRRPPPRTSPPRPEARAFGPRRTPGRGRIVNGWTPAVGKPEAATRGENPAASPPEPPALDRWMGRIVEVAPEWKTPALGCWAGEDRRSGARLETAAVERPVRRTKS